MRKQNMRPEEEHLSQVVDTISRQREPGDSPQAPKKETGREKRARKRSEKALRKKAKTLILPRTVQETVPYARVYPDSGIIETEDGIFTKSYLLDDVNYQAAKDEEQTEMFLKYAEFLNSFDAKSRFEITVVQQSINLAEFEAETMLEMTGDNLDPLRQEQNEILRGKIREGRNELIRNKYITVSLPAPSYEDALTAFARQDTDVVSNIKKIGGATAQPMSSAKRLELLHDIYNPDSVGLFGNNMTVDQHGELVFARENFRFDILRKMGLTTKDMVAPDSFQFHSGYGMVGSLYFRALFMRALPQSLKDTFLKELTDANCKMVTSLTYQPIDGQSALKMARDNIRNTNAEMIKKQEVASRSGYSPDLVSPELRSASEEAEALRDDLTGKNQKLFYLTLVIVHFADTLEQLNSDTKTIQAIGRRHLVEIKPLTYQQENGLNACLPLCCSKLEIRRSLITESAAVFMPFVNQELNDRNGGIYYGNNAVSHNLILHNRRNSKNGNGMILGQPGGGKSMAAKGEMLNVLLSSDDTVIVIDPDGEYYRMAELLGGEVIRIAPGAGIYLNPFDIEMKLDEDPITIKSDFISSMCETILGDRYGLTAGQKSIIDRCVKRVYEPYLNSFDPTTGKYSRDKLPTLLDFYSLLREQDGYEALQLADGLEIYATGSLDIFAHRTNVEYRKRFVVYDISKIGSSMKSLGLQVILDNLWNRMAATHQEGRYTWVYIDEIYLLFQNAASAEFLRQFYKRDRKYGGIATGITQNVTDVLESDIARTIISNCEFLLMLSQAPLDRAQLGELLSISPTQMDYITNAGPGQGLLYDGVHLVPFINDVPKESKQYAAMTTKPSEVKAIEEQTAQCV